MDHQTVPIFPNLVPYSEGYRLPDEEISEGSFMAEPNLPNETGGQHCLPVYSTYPLQLTEREAVVHGVQADVVSGGSTAGYTSSDYQPEDDLISATVCRRQYDDIMAPLAGYDHCHTSSEPCSQTTHNKRNASAPVLKQLDNILRKKIHLELEDFQTTLNEVLDGHMEHINHLFNLSIPTDTEILCASQDGIGNVHQLEEDKEINETSSSTEVDMLCYKSLVSLYLSANTINETLTNKRKPVL